MRPRPFLIVTAITALAGTPLHAQVAERYVGVTGGATSSDLSFGTGSTSARWGFTAGLTAGAITFDYSFVELQPSWTQLGGGDVRLDYVDVPLLIGALVPLGDRSTLFRLYAGIGLGIKIGCTGGGTVGTLGCATVNSTVWSLPLGISLAREIGDGRFLGVDGRYAAPLSNSIDFGFTKNRSWQVRALFGLPIGG